METSFYRLMRTMAMLFVLGVANFGHAQSQGAVGVRLVLGLADRTSTQWDGSVAAQSAEIQKLEPWRFDDGDALTSNHSWRISTHPIRLFGGGGAPRPVVANGVIVWLERTSDVTELQVKTAQGNFAVRLRDIPYGRNTFALNGRVMADRIPAAEQITVTPDEEDYPAAAADKRGDVWLAYVDFRHNPDQNRLRQNFTSAPVNFDDQRDPTGGDQILTRRYSQGRWDSPLAISPAGGDVYRPAIAADGSGRVWVFWSANQNHNFDLWARPIQNGKPGAAIRLSREPGSDVFPAAATDASGRVWVAWQGWRDGRASIFAAVQNGSGFSPSVVVSSSSRDEWNPAIAADAHGNVTVAWDSYRNGNFDVYLRTASSPGHWGSEKAVAASSHYEAYPSIAYDPSGRLWVAYEEGAERWGKDWGAYDTEGVSLYQGRAIRLRGFDGNGRDVDLAADVGQVLPGEPSQRVDQGGRQSDLAAWLEPNPQASKERQDNRTSAFRPAPKNTMPRLQSDSSGRIWLAFRSAHPIWWNPVGTVWSEFVASYDGTRWTGPVFLAHSDNLLDNRPALISTRAGQLLVIGSSDKRRDLSLLPQQYRGQMQLAGDVPVDPYNNDLYANLIELPAAPGPVSAIEAKPVPVAAKGPADLAEEAALAKMRGFRAPGSNLRIVRGEFHRHSEISMDGGSDGSLLDQWRYILDAVSLDWVGCCDHDNGGGREYSWWTTQKETDIFYSPGQFAPMFNYERSVAYPEGHRNVIFVERGIRTLPRLPKMSPDSQGHAPDTLMLYRYLKAFNGIVASHTSGTNMGTDWRDNDPTVEPAVEIYQGLRQNYEMADAPRANSPNDSIGGYRPLGYVNLAFEKGYKLSFQASSDHVSTHISYGNLFATDDTREAVLDALRKRHIYGSTDNILADFRCGSHMLGDAFTISTLPELHLRLSGTAPFAKVQVIKDNKYVYSTEPRKAEVDFTWVDNAVQPGKTSYYYVRGVQEDGNIVWVSPMWITYQGR